MKIRRNHVHLAAALTLFVTNAVGQPTINSLYPPALSDRVGDHVAYSVSATASLGSLRYAWYQSGNAPVLSASNALVLVNLQPTNAGSYYVVVSDSSGATPSSNVTLNVLPAGTLALYSSNIIVARVGDGAQTLSGATGNTIYLDQYQTNGTYVDSIQIPDEGLGLPYGSGSSSSASLPVGSVSILVSGSNVSPGNDAGNEALLGRAPTGLSLSFGGYCLGYPYSGSDISAEPEGNGGNIWRGIATVDAFGNYTMNWTNTGLYSGGNHQFHAVIDIDGNETNYYTTGEAGSQNSIKYCNIDNEPANGSGLQAVVGTLAGTRVPQVVAGNLVYSDQGASPIGLYVCSGLPQATASASLLVSETNKPMDFAFSPDLNTVYIADSGTFTGTSKPAGGVQRWDASGSGPDGFPGYSYSYTLQMGTGSTAGGRGLTVDFSSSATWGAGVTGGKLYVTTAETSGSRLLRIVDNGASSSATVFTATTTSEMLSGIRFGPVFIAPTYSIQPQSGIITLGDAVSFTAAAVGTGPLAYQWYFQSNGVGAFTAITNATNATYSISSVESNNLGNYYVVVTDTVSVSIQSQTVSLSLNEPTAMVPNDTNYVVSLNGMWDFYFERSNYNLGSPPSVVLPPDSQPFQMTNYVEGSGWSSLAVPGNWEMYGFSPCTYYVPDDTCGLYRNWIQIPQSWQGRRVYLSFDGVLTGAEIWLNGQPVPVNEPSWGIVNFHESAWTGFQVDLTSQVQFGTSNLLAVRVIKSTPSDDLDTGDYFYLGGIYRPVTLYSVPQTNFADMQVNTYLLSNNTAQVSVLAGVTGGAASTPVAMFLNGVATLGAATNGQVVFNQIVSQPLLWSAEFPNLYGLTLQLMDANSNVTETVSNHIGIRQITITNGILYLNGVPVKFAGVGTHDSSPAVGSAVTSNFWRQDILKMKAANINAIRTCHYPYDSVFYDLCDELGMYVSDELPYCWCDPEVVESSMEPAFVQRAQETIRRDRNHPSVMIWAIGNENSAGANLAVVANLVQSLDPTRPSLVSTFNASHYNTQLSDAHYPDLPAMESDAINAQQTGHPYIFLENPNTWDERLGADPGMWEDWGLCLQRIWNVCQQYSTLCGTFPFEWADRSVQDPNSNESYFEYESTGVQLLYYFPETGVHLLKMKGMVDGFRDERPNVYETRMIYSPVQISNALTVSPGQVTIPVQNRYSFTDLGYLTTEWQLSRDGITLASGSLSVSLPPLTSGNIHISVPSNALSYADSLRLDFIHPDGDDIYTYQFALTNASVASTMTTNFPAALPLPAFNLITYRNYNDPSYWTECERFPAVMTNIQTTPPLAVAMSQLTSLSATMESSNGQVLGQLYAGFTNNVFSYTLQWTGPTTNIQELGWIFQMPANDYLFSWNRNGRWTYYPPTDIGRASGTATPATTNADPTDMSLPNAFDFNSTKYNCNWASLTDPTGHGLRLVFSSSQPFHCSAGSSSNGSEYELIANQEVSRPQTSVRTLCRICL